VSNFIQDAIRAQRQLDDKERQMLLHQQLLSMFDDHFRLMQLALDGVNTNASKLLGFVTDNPEFAGHPKLGGMTPKIEACISFLTRLMEQLHGQEVKTTTGNGSRFIEGETPS
jgi:hypothetical protein